MSKGKTYDPEFKKVLNLLEDRITPKPDNYQFKQKHETNWAKSTLGHEYGPDIYIDKNGSDTLL